MELARHELALHRGRELVGEAELVARLLPVAAAARRARGRHSRGVGVPRESIGIPWIGLEKFRAAYTRAAAILSASTLAYRPRH